MAAEPASALQGSVMPAAPSPVQRRRPRSRTCRCSRPRAPWLAGSDAILEPGQRLRYEPGEALPAPRRSLVRPARSQGVQLGVLGVEAGVGLAGREPPRGVERGVVGGGVHERGQEGDCNTLFFSF